MDRIMGVAVVAMAKKHGSNKRDGSFGTLLIAEGGDAPALGQQWDEGMALIAQGHQLSGWFVSRKQNKEAEALVLKGRQTNIDRLLKFRPEADISAFTAYSHFVRIVAL